MRETHEYILSGSQIIRETVYLEEVEQYTLVYIYDELGAPIGIKYRTPSYAANVYDCYFFEKNLQGDIIAIYNSSGTKIVTYTYDAWGNVTTQITSGTASKDRNLANNNPFRYRGYYYDTDIGMYYLQSRYYNPEWGRFLNADGQISDVGGDILGYNVFSYCMNNPVNMSDSSGNWPKWANKLVAAVAVVAVVATVAAVTVATAGAGSAIAAVAVGAAKGAAIGLASGAATGAALGYATTGTLEGTLDGMANGALAGAVSGAISGGIKGFSSYTPSAKSFKVDPKITEALNKLDQTGIKPGQTQISQSRVLEILNSYDPLKAQSSYTNINGSLYVSEGHHTMIANVIKYGKLNTGINMGTIVNDPSVVTNMLWSTIKIVP